jgi:hypothetical protein
MTSPVPSTGAGMSSTTKGEPNALRTAAFMNGLSERKADARLNLRPQQGLVSSWYWIGLR